MHSPIARALVKAARLTEWAHRRIHGPQFAPGDVVEFSPLRKRALKRGGVDFGYYDNWLDVTDVDASKGIQAIHHGDRIREWYTVDQLRVVRYGEGE